ncbi:uncharacterized protein N7473_005275 [Penicillium subrubescens]|uniref:uncharacterized protein n=1 Tax=Penicillium subrubescens TaxID=1316194 RepID=UPI0025458C22|nr:uncharacterized protein N7473_005275 [Penicillium subrubescens]KAJ5895876.1 hypothetical protein N7473_005275 [Penicillium subrubescens]
MQHLAFGSLSEKADQEDVIPPDIIAFHAESTSSKRREKEANGPKDCQETRQSNNYQVLCRILIHRGSHQEDSRFCTTSLATRPPYSRPRPR